MKVEFLKKFSKDIDDVDSKSIKQNLLHMIELMESIDSLNEIPNTKKLKGHKSAYRTRVGGYQLGFFLKMLSFKLPGLFTEKIFTKFFA